MLKVMKWQDDHPLLPMLFCDIIASDYIIAEALSPESI
jgi:hypothetical protein